MHEGLHAIHFRHGAAIEEPGTVAASILCEGLAVALSRLLVPGHPDSIYLWFDVEHHGWVQECRNLASEITRYVSRYLDSTDETPETAGLLRTRPMEGLPSRCGYWLGDQMVTEWIASGTTPAELLRLPLDQAVERAREWILAAAD